MCCVRLNLFVRTHSRTKSHLGLPPALQLYFSTCSHAFAVRHNKAVSYKGQNVHGCHCGVCKVFVEFIMTLTEPSCFGVCVWPSVKAFNGPCVPTPIRFCTGVFSEVRSGGSQGGDILLKSAWGFSLQGGFWQVHVAAFSLKASADFPWMLSRAARQESAAFQR